MTQTVLFLCPHNAAKSVIAAAYFNQMAELSGLSYVGDSAGTEPSEAVSPVVVRMLHDEGMEVSGFQPRAVTSSELQTAVRVISIGCTREELSPAADRAEYWDDVPPVSENPEGARDAIRQHVAQLVAALEARRVAPHWHEAD
jgi:protein-tyrosine-phosphatase